MSGDITLGNLAEELNLDRSVLRRFILRMGFSMPHRKPTAQSRGAKCIVLPKEIADKIRLARQDYAFDAPLAACASKRESGQFYILQLVPELDPRRLKFGYASTLTARLADHRCVAPTLKLVASWPCEFAWERAAIDCLAVISRHVGGEVFDVEDVDAVIARASHFFSLLPHQAANDVQDIPVPPLPTKPPNLHNPLGP